MTRYSPMRRRDEDDMSDDSGDERQGQEANVQLAVLAAQRRQRNLYLGIGAAFLLIVTGLVVGLLYWKGVIGGGSGSDSDSTSKSTASNAMDLSQKTVTVTQPAPGVGSKTAAPVETETEEGSSRPTGSASNDHEGHDVGDEEHGSLTRAPSSSAAPKPKPTSSNPPSSPSNGNSSSNPVFVPSGAVPLTIAFDDYTEGTEVESYLQEKGLTVSGYGINIGPLTSQFVKSYVGIKDGVMRLKVKGDAEATDVQSSEVVTVVTNMLYAQITTRAKATSVAGVCHGFFYYLDGDAEIDIEILTSYITEGLENGIGPGLQSTSHGPNGKSSNKAVPYPWDPTAAFHNYTILWESGLTTFSIDGDVVATLDTNVPARPGPWVWNSWSSGEPQWSAGPPSEDNFLEIESISGWYFEG